MGSERAVNGNPLHPRALAYVGDAVYELHVRELALAQGIQVAGDLHKFTIRRAKADFQVGLLSVLDAHLTDAEREVLRQGRNVTVSVARRANQALHRQASGFEALIGHWHLNAPARLQEMWQVLSPVLLSGELPDTADSPAASH